MRKVVAITYCDFGEAGRKDKLAKHYTFKGALSGYQTAWNTYHRLHGWKVWQEAV